MKLEDLRKEAVSGIEPDRKWKKQPILTKRGFLPNSPEFHLASMRVNCECGACVGIKLGYSICPVCGRDLNALVNQKKVVDFGISEPLMKAVKKTSLSIKELAKAIRTTNDFHKSIDNSIPLIPHSRLGLPEHFYSRCTKHYPLFDPTDARIADLQRHKITYANVCEEEPILSPLLLPDDNKGRK